MSLKNTNLKNFHSKIVIDKLSLLMLSICFLFPLFINSQTNELTRHYTPYNVSLKSDNALSKNNKTTLTEEVSETGATWLRVFFKDVNLGSNSSITITSKLDGASQTLTTKTIKDWKNASAYFNGDAVTVTLSVAENDKSVGVHISELGVGELDTAFKSICGPNDDRVPSSDKAIGRIAPNGCTGWLIRNGRLVTAAHCPSSRAQLIEFNIPKSNSNGSLVHPGPEDQYPIGNFVSNFISGRLETDWAVFRAGTNSETGLTPIQAQGKSFKVVRDRPSANIRITGYGNDTGADNQIQQTHTGPLASVDNSFVRYTADTRGGNSGCPIIDAATGYAVGVHAYGGCTSSGGSNFGARATVQEFWDAMMGPDSKPLNIVRIVKRNTGFALDGKGGPGTNGQNVHIWQNNPSNVNQQWEEIDQGNGFYSYIKRGTFFAIDGRSGGFNGQNVHLWQYNKSNFNQHWKKVSVGGGFYRLEKRSAPGFSIDGRSGGANGQNVHLWSSNNSNQNQHWQFVTTNSSAANSDSTEFVEEIAENNTAPKEIQNFSIFPNPMTDTFYIQLDDTVKQAEATIFSITGSKKLVIKLKEGINKIQASDASLSTGVYLIKVDTGADIFTQKLIVK